MAVYNNQKFSRTYYKHFCFIASNHLRLLIHLVSTSCFLPGMTDKVLTTKLLFKHLVPLFSCQHQDNQCFTCVILFKATILFLVLTVVLLLLWDGYLYLVVAVEKSYYQMYLQTNVSRRSLHTIWVSAGAHLHVLIPVKIHSYWLLPVRTLL